MPIEIAKAVCIGAAVVGVVIWLMGYMSISKLKRPAHLEGFEGIDRRSGGPDEDRTMLTGSREVKRPPGDVSKAIVAWLASNPAGGALQITESTESRVAYKAAQGGNIFFGTGVFDIEPTPGGCEVRYRIDLAAFGRKLWIAGVSISLLLALPGATILPAMLYIFVASHEDPSVRWQALQSLQMIHGLWPPFLFGFIFRRIRKHIGQSVEMNLANLEHL